MISIASMKPKDIYRREHVRFMVIGPDGVIFWLSDNGVHDTEEYLKMGYRAIRVTELYEEMEL